MAFIHPLIRVSDPAPWPPATGRLPEKEDQGIPGGHFLNRARPIRLFVQWIFILFLPLQKPPAYHSKISHSCYPPAVIRPATPYVANPGTNGDWPDQ